MADLGIDVTKIKTDLVQFFKQRKPDFSTFGNTVNQVFEAFVFASVVKWYQNNGWTVEFVHPTAALKKAGNNPPEIRLKFSTRGRPENYTYAKCEKAGLTVQIRHQIRVSTARHRNNQRYPANICLDVAVIRDIDLTYFDSNAAVPNSFLVTFGEAKHMSAFAELMAGFIGMVYELQPNRLKRTRIGEWSMGENPSPFLYVSGFLYRTALGIQETVRFRKFDIDVYTRTDALAEGLDLPPRV